ncbi:molybdenum cofactor cytidylyltransferase [Clostridium oceanicum]|uniref:Molybdenum cofactor cytidylyltransferase n=1 Tax=Clostridium oceanicum TaxID=1543 RepID=A0ABP3V1B4_9CLOT
MVTAIIMASGFSKRMGKNKLMMNFKGKPIIKHVIDNIKNICFNEIIFIGRDKDVLDIAKKEGLNTFENTKAYKGKSEAIKIAVKNAKTSDGYMFLVGDQPFIDEKTIKTLLDVFEKNKDKIIIPKYRGRKGNPTIFPFKYKDDLMKITGDEGGKTIINSNLDKRIFVQINSEKPLIDIDTMEEYKKLVGGLYG